MSSANRGLRRFALPVLVLALALAGCMTPQHCNSLVLPGGLVAVTKAPLAGNLPACTGLDGLKSGQSTDVVFLQYYLPVATAGNTTLRAAMRDGGIKELCYADYSVRWYLFFGMYSVTAYGR